MYKKSLLLVLLLSGFLLGYSQQKSQQTEVINGKLYYIHHVEKGNTIYNLSKLYNIPDSIIQNFNHITPQTLQIGMILKIPASLNNNISNSHNTDINISQNKDFKKNHTKKSNYNIVFLIPFQSNTNLPTLNDIRDYQDIAQIPAFEMIQFYEAALIAIKEFENTDITFNITVKDLGNETDKCENYLKENFMASADLIIGPFYRKTFSKVAEFAKQHQIPIVMPFSNKSDLIINNPYVFKVTTSEHYKGECLADYIKRHDPSANIIIWSGTDSLMHQIGSDGTNAFTSRGFSVKKATLTQGIAGVKNFMSSTQTNYVIGLFQQYTTVANNLRNLYLSKPKNLNLVGLESWQDYDNIETEYFQDLNIHYCPLFFVDYTNENVKLFVETFRDLYHAEPEQYAFQGYDITKYFMNALFQIGADFYNSDMNINIETLSMPFRFIKKNKNNGFENSAVNIIKLNEYTYERLN